MTPAGGADVVAFGEKVLSLLDEARYSTTYKHALLLGTIDTLRAQVDARGMPPTSVPVRDIAQRVLQTYWHQAFPFDARDGGHVLRQSRAKEARIIRAITGFRNEHGLGDRAPLGQAVACSGFDRLVDDVEWTLANMPLPRLQRPYEPFIYDIPWDEHTSRRAYARTSRMVGFRPGAAEHLVVLAGLVRPAVERHWAGLVAAMNADVVDEARLDHFLFHPSRRPPRRLVQGLRDIQGPRCFYCDGTLGTAHVDHFLPWSQTGDDGIDNLVLACARCNGDKSALLAGPEFVLRWAPRFSQGSLRDALDDLAAGSAWPRRADHTRGWARSLYLAGPPERPTWLGLGERGAVVDAMASARSALA